jgi:phosphoglycolate phosphatase-like HAD superfamily hydrolase
VSEAPVVVLFDIDGTLITTGGAGARAWGRAFAELYDVSANIEDYTEAGMPDQEVLAVTFRHVIGRAPGPREIASLMAKYLEHLPETVAESTTYTVFPGVHELLTRLSSAGDLLGLTTGNVEAAARIKIARAGLNRFFPFGGYGSDSVDRGELTRIAIDRAARLLGEQPAASYVVGDTPRDVQAAHEAHAIAVGVATGHFSVDQLHDAGAEFVLRTFADDPFPTLATEADS